MKLKEIYDILNAIAPFETQASWDNSGLNLGNFESEIDKIYVALELDFSVLDSIESSLVDSKNSKNHNFNTLLITHHPPIFKPIKNFDTSIYPCNLLECCIKNNISIISMHTNFDLAHLNNAFADTLRLETIGYTFKEQKDFSLIYSPKKLQNIESILKHLKKILNLKIIKYSKGSEKINDIYITCGSGASSFNVANSGDCVITGDVKYHDAMIANSYNISFIEISHFQSEHIFAPLLTKILQKYKIQAIISNSHNPFSHI